MQTSTTLPRTLKRDLAQVVEPLVSYVCAADRPRDALLSALAVLFSEVKETNGVALKHFTPPHAEALGLAS